MSDSTVTIVGSLVREPEIRFSAAGRASCTFGLAVNRRYQQNGEWQEEVSFFNVIAWGDLAENAAASLAKGVRAIVSGRLEQRSWEKDGEKRSTVQVVADEVGPSLRWARAEVERITRDKPSAGTSLTAARANRAPDPVYGDEVEPF